MNNFPAMTEEQRQELIELCEEVLACHVQYGGDSNEEDIYKIALAALTARPKGFVESKSNGTDCFILKGFYLNGLVEGDELYTAPPAPVLKPIELASDMKSNPRAHHTMQAYRDGWNDRGKADVDMLLSAGYEVKQ